MHAARSLRSARMTHRAAGSPRRAIASALTLATAAALSPVVARAQTLRRASEAVHTGSSERRRSSDEGSAGRGPSSPSTSPAAPGRWFRSRYFLPFPYAWGCGGYEVPPVATVAAAPRSPRSVAVIASLDGGLAVSAIGRGGVGLRVLGSNLEFELRYSAFAEPAYGQTLWVGLGRYRGAVTLGDSAAVRVRVFGGLLHWIDDRGSEFGGEGGLGVDAFPGEPWVLSFDLSGGFVGQAGLVGLRGTVGYLVGPVELLLGWQHESVIPAVSGGSVDLSGPLAGVRIWR